MEHRDVGKRREECHDWWCLARLKVSWGFQMQAQLLVLAEVARNLLFPL